MKLFRCAAALSVALAVMMAAALANEDVEGVNDLR